MIDYVLASTQLMHAAASLSVAQLPPESDHCPLTLSLHLQAQNAADPEHTPQVQGAGSDVNLQQIRYNVNKVDKHREALRNLINPVFGVAAPPECLATIFYSHAFHKQLLPPLAVKASTDVRKLNRNGMMQNVRLLVEG